MTETPTHFQRLEKQPGASEMMSKLAGMAENAESFATLITQLHGLFPDKDVSYASIINIVMPLYHRKYGCQTFVIEPELRELFENTPLDHIPLDRLRFPYELFYVVLPEAPWKLWGGPVTGWHQLRGFYLGTEAHNLMIHAWADENEKSIGPGDDATAWAACQLTGPEIEKTLDRLFQPRNAHTAPLLDPLRNDWYVWNEGAAESEAINDALRACIRIAINLSLYLTLPNAQTRRVQHPRAAELQKKLRNTKNPGKVKKYERQLDALKNRTVIRVGEHLVSQVRALRKEHPESRRAHWVRGHWRRYHTGAGRKNVELRWIMPFPRGFGEPGLGRTYDVK